MLPRAFPRQPTLRIPERSVGQAKDAHARPKQSSCPLGERSHAAQAGAASAPHPYGHEISCPHRADG